MFLSSTQSSIQRGIPRLQANERNSLRMPNKKNAGSTGNVSALQLITQIV